MTGARVRRILLVGAVAGAATAAIKVLRGVPSPAFSRPPPRVDGILSGVPAASAPSGRIRPADTSPAGRGAPEGTGSVAWVAPIEGTCPPGFEVKVKLRSGIYHLPGMLAYERTKPDRCYKIAEQAEADGFRPAKR